ncbi:MAG: hypothetical protein JW395_4000 [Nitrospira sp.]|nr:hypothetical protein [Nitrospira sp.]
MLDTIRLKPNRLFHQDITDHLPDGWKSADTLYNRSVTRNSGTAGCNRILLTHKLTGMRVGGSRSTATWLEVSLPRLLHGHNGRLIANQKELDDALAKLNNLVGQVCLPAINKAEDKFTRVDLVLQFRDNPAAFKAAHRNCRHSWIRREAGEYDGESIYWKGADMTVRIYDKQLEQRGQPGNIVRVEVELRREALKKAFFGMRDSPEFEWRELTSLSFGRCYEVYREIMCGFRPARLRRMSSMAEFLAMADQAGWKWEGVPAFDLWRIDKCAHHVRRVRKEMARLRPHIHHIDWEVLLPEDEFPPLVELT